MISLSRSATVVVIVVLLLLIGAIIGVYYVYISPTGLKARETSPLGQSMKPDETLYVSLEGVPLDMRSFEGRFLVVNMWASWSPFTKDDHAVLDALKQEFGTDITIRAINRKEDTVTASAYLDTIGRKDGIEYVVDTTDFLYTKNEGYAMPETIIFDQVGNVVTRFRGVLSLPDMRSTLAGLLNETE